MEGLIKKEKGLSDVDNSEVMAGGRGAKEDKWHWNKEYNKNLKIKRETYRPPPILPSKLN